MELSPEIVEGRYYLIEGRKRNFVVPVDEMGDIPTGDRDDLLNELSDREIGELEEQLTQYTDFKSLTQVRSISQQSGVLGRLATDWIAGPGGHNTFQSGHEATRFLMRVLEENDNYEEDSPQPNKRRAPSSATQDRTGAVTEDKLKNDDQALVIKEIVPKRQYNIIYGGMGIGDADRVRDAMAIAEDFIVDSSKITDPKIYLVTRKGIERLD